MEFVVHYNIYLKGYKKCILWTINETRVEIKMSSEEEQIRGAILSLFQVLKYIFE